MSFSRRIAEIAQQLFSTVASAGSRRDQSARPRADSARFKFETLERRTMFAAGDLDTTFSTDGFNRFINAGNNGEGTAVAVQSDGKTVVVGTDVLDDGNSVVFVVRLTTAGSLDSTFDGNGIKLIDFGTTRVDVGTDVKLLSGGKILVAGSSSSSSAGGDDFALARLNSNGALDSTFSGDGKFLINFSGDDNGRKIVVDASGKIVMVGTTFKSGGGDVAIARVNSNGTLDTSFSGDGKQIVDTSGAGDLDSVSSLALAPNGKYVVGATTFPGTSGGDFQVNWFHPSGNLYRTKRMSMGGNDFLNDLAMDSGGKITAVGSATFGGRTMPGAVRLTSTGVYDSSFSGDGKLVVTELFSDNVSARSVTLASGGKIIIGASADVLGDFDFAVGRLNANGTFDNTFSEDGFETYSFPPSPSGSGLPDDFLRDMIIAGGKLIAVGSSTIASGEIRMAVTRVLLT